MQYRFFYMSAIKTIVKLNNIMLNYQKVINFLPPALATMNNKRLFKKGYF